MAARLGAQTADHLEQIDEAGIRALASANVQPLLLPASVYTLGSKRFAPARAMLEAGLPIVLATDFNPGSDPRRQCRLCCRLRPLDARYTGGGYGSCNHQRGE